MNQVVKWDGGQKEIVVRPGLVEDEIVASAITQQLVSAYPDGSYGFWQPFASLCSQTVSSKGLEFQPELVRNMDPAQRKMAYEAFLKLPKQVRAKWKTAVDDADAAVDVDLGPDPLPESASKKA